MAVFPTVGLLNLNEIGNPKLSLEYDEIQALVLEDVIEFAVLPVTAVPEKVSAERFKPVS